jgi:hypothetical protein
MEIHYVKLTVEKTSTKSFEIENENDKTGTKIAKKANLNRGKTGRTLQLTCF